jgi:hypothetical protein
MAKTPSGNSGRLRSRTSCQRHPFAPAFNAIHDQLDVAQADKARREARSGNSLAKSRCRTNCRCTVCLAAASPDPPLASPASPSPSERDCTIAPLERTSRGKNPTMTCREMGLTTLGRTSNFPHLIYQELSVTKRYAWPSVGTHRTLVATNAEPYTVPRAVADVPKSIATSARRTKDPNGIGEKP